MKRAVAFITALIIIYTAGPALADGGYQLGQTVICTATTLDNITLIDETKTTDNEEYESSLVTDTNVSNGKSTFIGVDVEQIPIEIYDTTDIELIAADNEAGLVEYKQQAQMGIDTSKIDVNAWLNYGNSDVAGLVEKIFTEESQTTKDLRESQEKASGDIIKNATSKSEGGYADAIVNSSKETELEILTDATVRKFDDTLGIQLQAPDLKEAQETAEYLTNLFTDKGSVGGFFTPGAAIVSRPDLYEDGYEDRYVPQTMKIEISTENMPDMMSSATINVPDAVETTNTKIIKEHTEDVKNVRDMISGKDMSREEVERVFMESNPDIDMGKIAPLLDFVYDEGNSAVDIVTALEEAGFDTTPYADDVTTVPLKDENGAPVLDENGQVIYVSEEFDSTYPETALRVKDGKIENNDFMSGVLSQIYGVGIQDSYQSRMTDLDSSVVNYSDWFSYSKVEVPYTKETRNWLNQMRDELDTLEAPTFDNTYVVISKYSDQLGLTPYQMAAMATTLTENAGRETDLGVFGLKSKVSENLNVEITTPRGNGLTVTQGMYLPLELETALYFVMGAEPPEYMQEKVERSFNGGSDHGGVLGGGSYTTMELVQTAGQSKEQVMDDFVENYLLDNENVEFYTIGDLKRTHPEINGKVNSEMYGEFDADRGFISANDWILGTLGLGERTIKMTNQVTEQEEEATISNTELDTYLMGTYGYVTLVYNGKTYYVKTEDLDAAINRAAEEHGTTDYFDKNYLVIQDDGKISTAIDFNMAAFLEDQIKITLTDPYYNGDISLNDLIDEYIDPSNVWEDIILDIAEATGEDADTVRQYWQKVLADTIGEAVIKEDDPAITAAWEEVKAGNTSPDITKNNTTTFDPNQFIEWLEQQGLLDETDAGKQPEEISKDSMQEYYTRYFDRYLNENSGLMIFDVERRIIKSAKAITERQTTNYKHMSFQWDINGGSPVNGGQTQTVQLWSEGETTVHAKETYQIEQESVMCYDYYEVWYIDGGAGNIFPIYCKEVKGGFAGLGGNTTDQNVISMSKTFGETKERDAGSWSFTVDQDEYGQEIGEDVSMGGSIIRTTTFVDGGLGYWINGVQMFTYPDGYASPVEETKSYRIE